MIAVDTNIVVRLLTQDDELQFKKSRDIFKNNDVFISDTVILETEWVLRFAYKFKSTEICVAFRNLCGLSNVYFNDINLIVQAIEWHDNGLDFADALHLAISQHCSEFYTFDEAFVKKAQGLSKSIVKKPDV
ncbi:MAG: type II toxin-antitoxin system VapC family toxin [Crinalium sp.]